MKYLSALILVAAWATSASAATVDWTNGVGDNNFGDTGNWSMPTSFDSADELWINLTGGDRAELFSDLPSTPDEIRVGDGSNGPGDGELLISGGTNTLSGSFRAGRGTSTGTIEMTGGTFSVPSSFSTLGDGGNAAVTMSGGTWNANRMTWGQLVGDTSTLDMTGGLLDVSGELKLGDGTVNFNIGGTGIINANHLDFRSGVSVLSLSSGELNLAGAAPLDISQADAGAGIVMTGGVWTLAGDQQTLISDNIISGFITSPGGKLDVSFGNSLTTVTFAVPEPASLVLLAFGAIGLYTRRSSR